MHQAFTTPDSHNPYALRIFTVNDSKRWMNQLPEEWLLKFGDYPANVRMTNKRIDPLSGGKPRPYGGYGDSSSVHQCRWNAGERVRHATCEVLCRGGVYPLPPRSSGTHHLSKGDTRVDSLLICGHGCHVHHCTIQALHGCHVHTSITWLPRTELLKSLSADNSTIRYVAPVRGTIQTSGHRVSGGARPPVPLFLGPA